MSAQPVRHLFTVAEYELMGVAGLFHEDDRVELIDGEIVEMTPIGARHAACVDRLTRLLAAAVGDRAIVRVQSPVRLGDRSEPQPDLALLEARDDFYASAHPADGEALLVVEVADTTGRWDREVKAPLYLRNGVPEVWVVDVADGCVHVFTAGGSRRAERGERLEPVALPGVSIAVEQVLA